MRKNKYIENVLSKVRVKRDILRTKDSCGIEGYDEELLRLEKLEEYIVKHLSEPESDSYADYRLYKEIKIQVDVF